MASNFDFIAPRWNALATRGREAEALFYADPNACLMKLRLFLEDLIGLLYANSELQRGERVLAEAITHLTNRVVPPNVGDLMHQLRMLGNEAAHEGRAQLADADAAMALAHRIVSWAAKAQLGIKDRAAYKRPARKFVLLAEWSDGYAALPQPMQVAARHFIERLRADPDAVVATLDPVPQRIDGRFALASLGRGYAVVVALGPRDDVVAPAWVDREEAAVEWARHKQVEVHPVTGTLQLYDPHYAPIQTGPLSADPGLFDHLSESELAWLGLPAALLPAVRELKREDQLGKLAGNLPPETYEALMAIAAGRRYADVLVDMWVDAPAPDGPVDPANFAAALALPESRRRMVEITSPEELQEILDAPLARWRVFLHPRQERIATADYAGPARAFGGAGTGKTVVLMHRARHLARQVFPEGRILVLTYTRTLAVDILANMALFCGPELARIEVKNLHQCARELLERAGRPVEVLLKAEDEAAWKAVFEEADLGDFNPKFYRSEWNEVVVAQGIETVDDYVIASRDDRPVYLSPAQRREVWEVFAAYLNELAKRGKLDFISQIRAAREALRAGEVASPYAAVLLDETQDMGGVELAFVRDLVPRRANDVFLVGDVFQKLFPRKVLLAECGIDVGDRTEQLHLAYRTTAQIRDFALAALADQPADDLDGREFSLAGYHAVRSGPAPEVQVFDGPAAEEAYVVAHIADLAAQGGLEGICLTSMRREGLDRFHAALVQAGVPAVILGPNPAPVGSVVLATMARVKGLEFKHVVIVGMGEAEFPPMREGHAADPAQVRQAQRSLYTTAGRARDTLLLTALERPSALLVEARMPDVAGAAI